MRQLAELFQSLWIKLGIPVEIIHPAFVKIVRRKQPPVLVELIHARHDWPLEWKHLGFFGQGTALAQIARRACGNNVVPRGLPTFGSRNDVIKCQIVICTTILTAESITQEYIEPRKSRIARRFYIGLKGNNGGQFKFGIRAMHNPIIFRNDINAIQKHSLQRILPAPQRQRIVTQWPIVGIQNECRAGLWRDWRVVHSRPHAKPITCSLI